jgi:hypothetical protein
MAEDHYPKTDLGRKNFWVSQLKLSVDHIEPYMKAGREIVNMYNSRATTQRRKMLKGTTGDSDEMVKSNIVFAWVDQSFSGMIEDDPFFSITPKTQASSEGQPVAQKVINEEYRDAGQSEEDEQMALDAHLLPYAVKKIGWTGTLENQKELYPGNMSDVVLDDPDEENLAMIDGIVTRPTAEQDAELHLESHMELLQTPGLPEEVGEIVTQHINHTSELVEMGEQPDLDTRVQWENPFGTRWPSDDFLMDAFANSPRDARFQAFRIRQPLHWWKNHPLYKNTEDLKPNAKHATLGDRRHDRSDGSFNDFAIVEGWEIWARNFPVSSSSRANLLIVLVETHDKILYHEEAWPSGYDSLSDYPSAVLQFQSNVKTWINKPTLTLAGANNTQNLVHEFFDAVLYTIRKQKNVFLYDPDIISPEDMNKILNAPDSSSISVQGLATAQGQPVQALPWPEVSQNMPQFITMLKQNFNDSAGTPQPIKGVETATESSIVEKRNTSRENRRQRLFNRMQVETAEKFWILYQHYQPDRMVMTDPLANKWVKVDDSVAEGQYRFAIDIQPRSQALAIERKSQTDLFNLLVGVVPAFLQLQLPPPNIIFALEQLLKKGYNVRDVENYMPAVQGQFQNAVKQLQNDPIALSRVLEAFKHMGGGGAFGPLGNGPGPANPQQFAASPMAADNANAEAQRVTEG